MKRVMLLAALCLGVSSFALADKVKVAGTEVTFEAPAGFEPLSPEIIAAKWPSNQAPAYAIGNPTGSTTVAYDVKPHPLPQEAMPEAQKAFTQGFERMVPGLVWKKNELIEHSGQTWLLLELTSNAIDADIYNIVLVTGLDGKMLVFNFNSTKEEFPRYEAELRRSLQSITLPH